MLKNGKERLNISKINTQSVELLENEIDKMNEKLPEMTHFIYPADIQLCHFVTLLVVFAEEPNV